MKRFKSMMVCSLFALTLFSCNSQKLETLGKCPVEMQTVTQKDAQDNTTYTLQIPKEWHIFSAKNHIVDIIPSKYTTSSELNLDVSLSISIVYFKDSSSSVEQYKNLISGNYKSFEQKVQKKAIQSGATVSDFSYKTYMGTHGKIVAVKYTYRDVLFLPNTYKRIFCYRADLPYFVVGGFNSSNAFSSGEVVPWVADSLQIDDKRSQ